jgi:glycosyltransferase involved in cell wall biosynthesis
VKIGILSCPSVWGGHGVEHWLEEITNRLSKLHSFVIACSDSGPKLWSPSEHFLNAKIVEAHVHGRWKLPSTRGLIDIKGVFDDCDLIYFVFWPASWKLLVLSFKIFTGKPVIAGHHMTFNIESDTSTSLLGPSGMRLGKRLAANHVLSEEQRRALLRLGVDHIYKIPNGVDCEKLQPGKKFSRFTLLFIGSLIPQKGVDFLPRIVSILKDRKVDFDFYVIGAGPLSPIVKKMSESSNTKWLGYTDEETKRLLLASSHVLVAPSRFETFMLTGLEAMASGTPVVASNISGPREYVYSGRNGYLCESPGEIAEGVAQIYEAWTLDRFYSELCRNARATAERFDWTKIVNELDAMFTRVAGTRKRLYPS